MLAMRHRPISPKKPLVLTALLAATVFASARVASATIATSDYVVWLPLALSGQRLTQTPSATPTVTATDTATVTATDAPSTPGTPSPDRLLASGQAWGFGGNDGRYEDGNQDDGDLIRGRRRDYEYDDSADPDTQEANLVVDRQTGLMWIRDVGLLDGADSRGAHANLRFDVAVSWQTALDLCSSLSYAGYDDWRVPNLKEMQTLVDYGRSLPAIDTSAFPASIESYVSPYAWTSTTYTREPNRAFYVNFVNGHTYPFGKAVQLWVRPVRSVAVDDPVAILRTGQTSEYSGDDGQPGNANRDDGDLQMGLVHQYAFADDGQIDTPDENVVVDVNTELVWVRDVDLLTGDGGVSGNVSLDTAVDWQTAIERINALEYAGHDDWRLPNIVELESISQPGRSDGLIFDPDALPGTPTSGTDPASVVWWSSTTSAFDRNDQEPGRTAAWYLTGIGATNFIDDDRRPAKSRPAYVRPVRDHLPRETHPLYVSEVRASSEWKAITISSVRPDLLREGKYIVAAGEVYGSSSNEPPATALHAAYQDVNLHPLHYEFLVSAFPMQFSGLTTDDYAALVSRRATRTYFAGGLKTFLDTEGHAVYGFDVYTDPTDDAELLTESETYALFRALGRTFRRRRFVYSPSRPEAVARARSWGSTSLPVGYPAEAAEPDFEAYTTGQAYGVVRRMTLGELADAAASGGLSH